MTKWVTGRFLYIVIANHINTLQYNERICSFKSKNNKLKRLIQAKSPQSNFKVPILNLSLEKLSVKERKQLEIGLQFSFVDKNKHLKKQLAVNCETLSHKASDCVHHQNPEDFHEFLRAYTDIFTKNVYATRDFNHSSLRDITKNSKLVLLSGNKDPCLVIMQREDYDVKLQNITDDGIRQGIYSPTVYITLSDMTKFQDFLHRNFKGKCDRNKEMRLISYQSGKIYATIITHKYDSQENITIQNLKFHLITSQIGKYTYNAADVLPEYLKPLCQNKYKINDTQSFASQIKKQPPLDEDEGYVSYDVDSLFTNIPAQETIDYIPQKWTSPNLQYTNKQRVVPWRSIIGNTS